MLGSLGTHGLFWTKGSFILSVELLKECLKKKSESSRLIPLRIFKRDLFGHMKWALQQDFKLTPPAWSCAVQGGWGEACCPREVPAGTQVFDLRGGPGAGRCGVGGWVGFKLGFFHHIRSNAKTNIRKFASIFGSERKTATSRTLSGSLEGLSSCGWATKRIFRSQHKTVFSLARSFASLSSGRSVGRCLWGSHPISGQCALQKDGAIGRPSNLAACCPIIKI